ncbi:MAG TPA: acetolactate decarboxylase [Ohtaekwangia sp.]
MKIVAACMCISIATLCKAQPADAIHYISLNSAIYLGQYDGTATAADLKKYGDFGVGSEEALSGEIVLLNGTPYTIPATGKAGILNPQRKIPFAAVKFFRSEVMIGLKQNIRTLKQLELYLDSLLDKNRFAAIKITAAFSYVKFRSFYEQPKPYVPLQEASEAFFEEKNFSGILVGFYTPKAADVLNSPTYHFHIIDVDKTTGGHLLECSLKEAKIEIDYATQLVIDLPSPDVMKEINLNQAVKKE